MTEIKTRLNSDGPFIINQELAGLVPMASEAEQAVLTADIDSNEQQDPIILWQGKVVDGRCRQLALTTLSKHIMYRELENSLTEEEVRVFVKSVNIRRNLTPTQKVISACRESLRAEEPRSVAVIAKSWGISRDILSNARYIAAEAPHYIDTLFDGGAVTIIDNNGNEKITNKVTTIYSYLKKVEEKAKEDTTYAWQEDTYINTQAGKEWYYSQVRELESTDNSVRLKMLVAELANYKFKS